LKLVSAHAVGHHSLPTTGGPPTMKLPIDTPCLDGQTPPRMLAPLPKRFAGRRHPLAGGRPERELP